MAYLLDSNVFITAKYKYYGFDYYLGLWRWVEEGTKQRWLSASSRLVKMPNVCTGVCVDWIDTFDMLRLEHTRFVLGR